MANHKSAIKQMRQSLKRNAINQSNKSVLRTQIKTLRKAIQDKNKDEAQALLPKTFSTIDKSIKKGAIHENQGNRHKSRLSRQVELLNASPSK